MESFILKGKQGFGFIVADAMKSSRGDEGKYSWALKDEVGFG